MVPACAEVEHLLGPMTQEKEFVIVKPVSKVSDWISPLSAGYSNFPANLSRYSVKCDGEKSSILRYKKYKQVIIEEFKIMSLLEGLLVGPIGFS